MKLKLLTPLLLTLTTLFFIANANAKTFNTNIPGLVIKELSCLYSTYDGRWVNRNNQSLGKKRIKISMYDSDGDRTGMQSTNYSINMGAKSGGDFTTQSWGSSCSSSYSFAIFVE
ncbi:hypothetical protein [Porticoccus sp. Uisw_050_02]|uniref:hypothetical protein n=1 Tax=Porticoccus sp. Uisw_050_02 TaxID=3230978 RepID=UPI0039EC543B